MFRRNDVERKGREGPGRRREGRTRGRTYLVVSVFLHCQVLFQFLQLSVGRHPLQLKLLSRLLLLLQPNNTRSKGLITSRLLQPNNESKGLITSVSPTPPPTYQYKEQRVNHFCLASAILLKRKIVRIGICPLRE